MLRDLVRFWGVELDLEKFVHIAWAFREEYFLVISSHQVPSDHGLWLADKLEEVTIEGCLDDTVVELND